MHIFLSITLAICVIGVCFVVGALIVTCGSLKAREQSPIEEPSHHGVGQILNHAGFNPKWVPTLMAIRDHLYCSTVRGHPAWRDDEIPTEVEVLGAGIFDWTTYNRMEGIWFVSNPWQRPVYLPAFGGINEIAEVQPGPFTAKLFYGFIDRSTGVVITDAERSLMMLGRIQDLGVRHFTRFCIHV